MNLPFQKQSTNLALVTRAWAAAASTAGAFAPKHVAHVLIQNGGDLVQAVLEGTKRAKIENEGYFPEPRGLEVRIRGGKAEALLWESDTHIVELYVGAPGNWGLRIWHSGEGESIRVKAAEDIWYED